MRIAVVFRSAATNTRKTDPLVCGSGLFCLDRLLTKEQIQKVKYFGIDIAWYFNNSHALGDVSQHPVGQKTSNAWKLYDMSGNVFEKVSDWYDSNYYDLSQTTDYSGFRLCR